MKVSGCLWVGAAVLSAAVVVRGGLVTVEAQRPVAAGPSVPEYNELIQTYCGDCHNDQKKSGNVSFDHFDMARMGQEVDLAEKMIRKLQAGMMPPPGNDRPDPATYAALIRELESRADAAAAARPNPGTRVFPRLNRPEYRASIKALLDLDVDPGAWLPLDQKSANFDNIADEQTISATLLESYLNAASEISRLAVGDRNAPPVDRTYTNTSYVSQHPWDQLEGAPMGSRGGIVVPHIFPVDGEYSFTVTLLGGNNTRLEDIDISLNGERISLVRYETQQSGAADGRGAVPMKTEPVQLKAGQYTLSAAFVRRFDGPYEDLIRPHDWSFAGAGSGGAGITTLPHLRDLIVHGPTKTTGISETASRRRIFTCRPTSAAEERPCARTIVSHLASSAYRRPVTRAEVDSVMKFYDGGAAKGGFEIGVRNALEAILASPHFIFRIERQPATARPGMPYRVSDIDLASRLSFFLWGMPPDQALVAAATRGELATVAGLEKHARRMLADPRAEALGNRFAAQWLRLQDVDKVHPDPNFYPNFEGQLGDLMKKETELFFNSLVKDDRSVLALLNADYTFLNERLARHYGIPGVAGSHFRKVTYPDDRRRGILGQGSILVQTSYANRTSPVLRGKWVMEVLLGTPPPPPPMDGSVPALEETAEGKAGRPLTTRERMELHAKNPTCNSCHRFIDPIGLALDNFDVTGKWRARENGMPLDTLGRYYDGTTITSPAELSAVLLKRPVPLVRTFTENLMAYALGRRVETYDLPAVRAIAKAAQANDYKMSAFLVGVVKSDAFRMRMAEPAVEPAAASGKKAGTGPDPRPSIQERRR
jgi:mono/diheme cytochrome c family protein